MATAVTMPPDTASIHTALPDRAPPDTCTLSSTAPPKAMLLVEPCQIHCHSGVLGDVMRNDAMSYQLVLSGVPYCWLLCSSGCQRMVLVSAWWCVIYMGYVGFPGVVPNGVVWCLVVQDGEGDVGWCWIVIRNEVISGTMLGICGYAVWFWVVRDGTEK